MTASLLREEHYVRSCLPTLIALAPILASVAPLRAAEPLTPQAMAQQIDRAVAAKLAEASLHPSAPASDAEFLRRVTLDLHGRVPSPEQVRSFLGDKNPGKRAQLVATLLADPRYGQSFALQWTERLVPYDPNADQRRFNPEPLTAWLTKQFNDNAPWDKLVYELLTATGPGSVSPAAIYLRGGHFGKKSLTANEMADSVSQLFLGNQIQCAQCHDHPYTEWKRTDYWGLAAFFRKVEPDGSGVTEQGRGKPPKLPDTAINAPAKFLDGPAVSLPDGPARPVLARWLVSPENPFFAKAAVNRVWHHFFGRGLVNPVNDMRPDNPGSHPELLKLLAEQFAAHDFDLRYLITAITSSQTYGRTSRSTAGNAEDHELYSHMTVRVLTGEQLYDSLILLVGDPGRPIAKVVTGRYSDKNRRGFTLFYNSDEESEPTDYPRGIPQALRSMNSPETHKNLAKLVEQLMATHTTPAAMIEALYVHLLARRPEAAEVQRMQQHLQQVGPDVRRGYQQVAWALLNSSEFVLNH